MRIGGSVGRARPNTIPTRCDEGQPLQDQRQSQGTRRAERVGDEKLNCEQKELKLSKPWASAFYAGATPAGRPNPNGQWGSRIGVRPFPHADPP